MFQNLSDRLNTTFKKIRGQGRLTEDNIQKTVREVKKALLEADVSLNVVQDFIRRVKRAALGREVAKSLSPGQAMIKVVKRELTKVMGEENASLNLNAQPPAVILMAGLQGSGKTTSSAKLARFLTQRQKKKVLMVSTDVYRPAAMEQLKTLGQELEIEVAPSTADEKPLKIAERAHEQARKQGVDVLIVDTAGRLHIDETMMDEVKQLHKSLSPVETLFVVDSMTGQDAVNTAKAFDEALTLTGVILTKADGDARGGAALSIRQVTGKPIKFLGVGEKTDALEPFHPDRIASRILGMGDVFGLIDELEHTVDRKQSDKMVKKLKKGKGFDLQDFADQLQQMNKMGGMSKLMDKLPGMGNISEQVKSKVNDKMTGRMLAIIQSMTKQERRMPEIIKSSRKQRIAKGSGTEIQEVNRLLKQFNQMQKMMKKVGKKGGMANLMKGMGGGMMPPGGAGGMFGG